MVMMVYVEKPRTCLCVRIQLSIDFIDVLVITVSAVALHCCKAHKRISRKTGNSIPCKIVTHERFAHVIMLGTATTVQIFVKIGSVEASPQKGEI